MKVVKSNKGFTLVEMLIVIAIIGVTAVMAAPNVMKYMEDTQVKKEIADLNALKIAVQAYYDDNKQLPVSSEHVPMGKIQEATFALMRNDIINEGSVYAGKSLEVLRKADDDNNTVKKHLKRIDFNILKPYFNISLEEELKESLFLVDEVKEESELEFYSNEIVGYIYRDIPRVTREGIILSGNSISHSSLTEADIQILLNFYVFDITHEGFSYSGLGDTGVMKIDSVPTSYTGDGTVVGLESNKLYSLTIYNGDKAIGKVSVRTLVKIEELKVHGFTVSDIVLTQNNTARISLRWTPRFQSDERVVVGIIPNGYEVEHIGNNLVNLDGNVYFVVFEDVPIGVERFSIRADIDGEFTDIVELEVDIIDFLKNKREEQDLVGDNKKEIEIRDGDGNIIITNMYEIIKGVLFDNRNNFYNIMKTVTDADGVNREEAISFSREGIRLDISGSDLKYIILKEFRGVVQNISNTRVFEVKEGSSYVLIPTPMLNNDFILNTDSEFNYRLELYTGIEGSQEESEVNGLIIGYN